MIKEPEKKSRGNICRTYKTSNFVTINTKPFYDNSLSGVAKALWAFGIGHPNNWVFYFSEMLTHFKEGKHALYNAFKELIEQGYVARFPFKVKSSVSDRWIFGGNEYVFFEEKKTKKEIQNILEEFKKSFPHSDFQDAHFENAQEKPLVNKSTLLEQDEVGNTYAPPKGSANAPPSSLSDSKRKRPPTRPKVPFRTACKISRLPDHPSNGEFLKHFNLPLISTSDAYHEILVKKHGEEKVIKAYNHLAEWKLSKAETEPSAVLKHADYYRITKWVMKEILGSLPGGSRKNLRRGKLAISGDQRAMEERKPSVSAVITDENKKKELRAWYAKMKKDAQDKELKEKNLV